MSDTTKRINFGCGSHAPAGWLNFDGSLRVILERIPLLELFGMKRHFSSNVRYLRVGGPLPFRSESVAAIYSSHMIEHLSRTEAEIFLRECFRILVPGGRIHLMTPSLRRIVDDYIARRSSVSSRPAAADQFMRDLLMAPEKGPVGFWPTLLEVFRRKNWHQWLYDEAALVTRMSSAGFSNIVVRENWISDFPDLDVLEPGELRAGSLCAEALKP